MNVHARCAILFIAASYGLVVGDVAVVVDVVFVVVFVDAAFVVAVVVSSR